MRPWHALTDLNDRTSLRSKLITALLALVAVGLVAISVASVMVLRSYLVSQDDSQLHDVVSNINNHQIAIDLLPGQAATVHGTNILVGFQQPGTPLSSSGSQGGLTYGGSPQMLSLPSVPTSPVWADAYSGRLLTVPAQSGSNSWRVITEPTTLSIPTITGGTAQESGTLVVGVDLGNINAVIGRLAVAELVIGFIIVCILGIAAVAVVRANLRPLVEIEETAGEIADGHLNRRVPERDPETEIGRLGRSLNIMLLSLIHI